MEALSGMLFYLHYGTYRIKHLVQREWNRVWRELDAKNCAKSLDHQGIYFKTSDRKNMGSKSLVLVIETLYKEQKEGQYRRSGVSNLPTNRYQFDFAFKDAEMFPDATKVIFSFVESSLALSPGDEAMFKDFVVSFSSKFFHLDEKTTAAMSEGESTDSKVPNDTVMTDADAHEGALNANGVPQTLKNKSRPSYSLYANTPFYVFFRLYQVCHLYVQVMNDFISHVTV